MALSDNNGTQYHLIPCGVASDSGLDSSANNGSKYFFREANDYILWAQPHKYQHPTSNNGSTYYFLLSVAPSDVGLDLEANNGSKFYFRESDNYVSFCD